MPHYPDEIEYSDKYTDDHYEYRHVILPKDVYKKLPRSRLLSESVTDFLFRNGELLEYSNQGAGATTSSTVLSPTSCSFGGPRALTPRPGCLPTASPLPSTPTPTDPLILIKASIPIPPITA